ncbi:MAG TPA: ABC transporter substrate-binding protein [Candidatus Nanoarchaeia archaeon]|nr:ABC transporter substrate-binding protein [Candidatus Nanoarchaeia archaeon]
MNKTIIFLLVLFACAQEETIQIGIIAPLTGPAADLGALYVEGAQVAVDDLNAKNFLDKPITLVIEDTGSDAKNAVTAMHKLTQVDDVNFIMTIMSTHGLALKPLANQYGVLLFGDVAHPNMTGDSLMVFRHSNIAEDEAKLIVSKARELNGTVGMLYSNEDFGQVFNRVARNELDKQTSVSSEAYDLKGTDFRSEIEKVADKDTVIVVGVGPAFNQILKQLNELGYKGNIITNLGFVISNSAQLGTAVDGIYYTDYSYTSLENWSEFVSKFKARFEKEPRALHSISYGTVELIAHGIKNSDETPKNVALFLHGRIIEGTFEKMQVTEKGDVSLPLVMNQY